MSFHILKPTKQRLNHRKIYGFDIETCDDNKSFLCASINGSDYSETFYNKRDFINTLKNRRFRGCYLAATNLSFDFQGIFYKEPEAMKIKPLFRGSDMITAEVYIYKDDYCDKYYPGAYKITFIDTMNYAPGLSVEKIGKILGIEKMEKPVNLGHRPKDSGEWKYMIDYNMRDSELSRRFIEFLFDSFERLGATPKKTIASTAMSLFKNKYLKEQFWRHSSDDLMMQFESYYGGRTEAFCRGNIKDYNYYDFNSLYPSVMMESFPDPGTMHKNNLNSTYYIKRFDGCSKVDIYCPKMEYPLLPYRTKEKVIFPYGNMTGVWTNAELRKAMDLGYIIKHIYWNIYFTENIFPFKDYVKDMYDKRLEYKSKKDPMEIVVKLLMNSLYGKFGQRFMDRDNVIPFTMDADALSKYDYIERIGDYIRVKQSYTEPSAFTIPIWASYVAAKGRLKLYDAIIKHRPVYCDTDSIMTKNTVEDSKELGELKLEMNIKEGIIVKPKFYALQDSKDHEYVKIKGVSLRMNFLEFAGYMSFPEFKYKKFMKFREAIKRDMIPNEMVDMVKELTLEDDKRLWSSSFDMKEFQMSDPLEIIDGITEIEWRKQEQKAKVAYEKEKEKAMQEYFESDLFDKHAVGSDISYQEFHDNETDYKNN